METAIFNVMKQIFEKVKAMSDLRNQGLFTDADKATLDAYYECYKICQREVDRYYSEIEKKIKHD